MTDPTKRFDTRAEDYSKYRPGYPNEIVGILEQECGLTKTSVIADVGSGTGILSKMFLEQGNKVIGIEPNAAMRLIAEQALKDFKQFSSIEATAETTRLANESVDFVVAAQAFHWFNHQKAKAEFVRILKPGGWVVLIWNERLLDSTPFLSEYEELLLRFGTDYKEVRHENADELIEDFFAPAMFKLRTLKNAQHFGFEGFIGRVRSASYTPQPGSPNYAPMLAELERIYAEHNRDGVVSIEYETKIFFGRL